MSVGQYLHWQRYLCFQPSGTDVRPIVEKPSKRKKLGHPLKGSRKEKIAEKKIIFSFRLLKWWRRESKIIPIIMFYLLLLKDYYEIYRHKYRRFLSLITANRLFFSQIQIPLLFLGTALQP